MTRVTVTYEVWSDGEPQPRQIFRHTAEACDGDTATAAMIANDGARNAFRLCNGITKAQLENLVKAAQR